MEELRRFITEVNHETGKIGDWEKTLESIPVVKSKFSEDVPEAVVREGADELTLRREEEEGVLRTLIDTTNVGDIGRKRPLVDGTGQDIYKGVEGAEWENVYCKYVVLTTLVVVSFPFALTFVMNHSALAFSLTPGFLRLTDLFCDKLRTEPQCDQRCPTAALEEALRRTEEGAGRGQSFSAGKSET